ncbi:insulinase family protein [Nocardiopsis mwathae]
MSNGPGHARRVVRHRLDNGLRIVLGHNAGSSAAVSVHYGAGFRSERPGEEGLAHFFEHLMTQDSDQAPHSAKNAAAISRGGEVGATTHPDYTDYYQAVPAEALDAVLHWEADRMRAPRFSATHVRQQLRGVAEEIAAKRDARPYGGMPWPLLPGVLYTNFANAHDGYGSAEVLANLSMDDFLAFFARYYHPGNAVLTVLADLATPAAEQRLLDRVRHWFAPLLGRPRPATPTLDEPPLVNSVTAERMVHGRGPVRVAIGYPLDDLHTTVDHVSYTAYVVAAAALERILTGAPNAELSAAASCGFFGPFDARTPDTFVAMVHPHKKDTSPSRVLAAVDTALERLADPETARRWSDPAARSAALLHDRLLADPLTRCRALGRHEVLFGDAPRAFDISHDLRVTGADGTAAAAAALRNAHRGVLIGRPTETRPTVHSALPPSVAAQAPSATTFEPRAWTPMPPAFHRPPDVDDQRLSDRFRLVLLRLSGATAAEVRLTIPVRTASAGRALSQAMRSGEAPAGALRRTVVRVRPGAVELETAVEPGVLARWAAYVGQQLSSPPPEPAEALHTPVDFDQQAVQWYLRSAAALAVAPMPITLVVCGDVDPNAVAESARTLEAAVPSPVSGRCQAPAPGAGGISAIGLRPQGRLLRLRLWAPAPPTPAEEAARYIAVSLFSSLAAEKVPTTTLRSGRAAPCGIPSLSISADCAPETLGYAASALTELIGCPPEIDPKQLDEVRARCWGQWSLAFDSPARLAGLAAVHAALGGSAHLLPRFPELLARVGPVDLRAAWTSLYGCTGFTGLVEDVVPPEALRDFGHQHSGSEPPCR